MTERLKPLRGEGAKLLKMVTEAGDTATLEQALELALAIGQPAEGLLEGVEVTAAGELLPSSRFRGTQATQAALDLLLVHQLSLAAAGTPEAALRQSVRRLTLACPLLPPLRGFDGLESLEITVPAGGQWDSLSSWGALPSLRTLTITEAGTKDHPACLQSLDGLHAPVLETAVLRGLGLTSVAALQASSALRQVNLAQNADLTSIDALAPSAACLTDLNLEDCTALEGISALAGAAALVSFNLKGCARVTSLKSLSSSTLLAKLELEGCTGLESLEGLCASRVGPMRFSFFSLKGCAALRSLQGLPPLDEAVSSLYLQEMPALVSLDGIEAASGIGTLVLEDLGITHLDGLSVLPRLKEVRVFDCGVLKDASALGKLPELARVKLRGCPSLARLPSVWGGKLKSLELSQGMFSSIGQIPPGLEDLEVRDIATLHNLQGVEGALALQEVSVDTHLRDASSLNGLPHACVRCFNGDAGDVTPAWVLTTLGMLKPLRLDLRFTSLKDLQFLLQLPDLQQVHIGHDARDHYGLKEFDYLTEAVVRTLQRAICKNHKVPVPDFLKPRRTSARPANSGGPSLVDIKRGLTSTDFEQVVVALEALRASGDPQLYDAVLEGVHAPTLYTGDTASLGKIFKDIRAPYRPWARWALTHVLMDAPESSVSARALSLAIESITWSISPIRGRDASQPLALGRFKSLKSVTLEGTDDEDLGFLRLVGPLETLTLKGLSRLTSLESLAQMKSLPDLQTLKLEGCGGLLSLKGLEGAIKLEMITASECAALHDFSAMSGLHSLRVFPGWSLRFERIDLTGYPALDDIQFVAGLRSAQAIDLKLQGRVDLSAVARLPQLQSLGLELDTLDQDFSPLAALRTLSVDLIDPETGYSRSLKGAAEAEHRHVWQGTFPVLETLKLSGGENDLAKLQAPELTSFEGRCRLPSLRGVGHCEKIVFYLEDCDSLDGLAGSPVTSLDLYYVNPQSARLPSFAVIHEVPKLHTLRIGRKLAGKHVRELTACGQIHRLQANGYSGSLAFLEGWTQLTEIDLRDSGELSDLETLCTLPSLSLVRLRGAAMKRDSWPKALQDRLDFKST